MMRGYCLMGRFDDAKELLISYESQRCKSDVVSYNTLISAYSKNKKAENAVNLYEQVILFPVQKPTRG